MNHRADDQIPWHIIDRDELVRALEDAAELEHQLMLQYLYAALSLKKTPDARCSPSQLEHVRRWGSTLYTVARQEMDHLAQVNNLLSGIGAAAYFGRQNIGPHGLLAPYFQAKHLATKGNPEAGHIPTDLSYSLSHFRLGTVRRMVCFESPRYDDLPPDRTPTWCFAGHGSGVIHLPRVARGGGTAPVAQSRLSPSVLAGMEGGIAPGARAGLLQRLYAEIHRALGTLPGLFTAARPQVAVPAQHKVYLIPVHDRASALAALELVLEHGEGIEGGPAFSSHFMLLYEICEELEKLNDESPGFEPSLPVLDNPSAEQMTNPFTRAVFELSQEVYVNLLLELTALYRSYVSEAQERYPFFSTALLKTAFTPFMTMLLRSLAEVLVRLDIGDGKHTAGPCFTIPASAQELLETRSTAAELGDIDFHLMRVAAIRDRLAELVHNLPEGLDALVRADLEHVFHSAHRMTLNLARVYQTGTYKLL